MTERPDLTDPIEYADYMVHDIMRGLPYESVRDHVRRTWCNDFGVNAVAEIYAIEIRETYGIDPWLEIWFQTSPKQDGHVAKATLADGSQVWCPADTRAQAMQDLLIAVTP